MAYYVNKVVKPERQLLLFCNYGQRTYDYEEFCIREISRRLKAPLKLIDMRRLAALITSDKDKVVKLGDELGVPWAYTYSCYTGHSFKTIKEIRLPVHCARCSSCKRRALAFKMSGVYDGSLYAKPPLEDVDY